MAQLHDLTALEAAAPCGRREVSPSNWSSHALDRDRAARRPARRVRHRHRRRGAGAGRGGGGGRARGRGSHDLPPLHGVPTAIKDLNLTRGVPDQARVGRLMAEFVRRIDDHVVDAAARGRHDQPRQDGDARVRPALLHRDRHRSAGAHARGTRPAGRRFERRRGGRGRGGFAADRAGQRRRRLDPHPGERVRTGRAQDRRADGSRAGPLDLDSTRLSVLGPLARTVRDAAAFLDAVADPAARRPRPAAAAAARRDVPRLVRSRSGAAAHRPVHRLADRVPRSTRRSARRGSRPARCSPDSATRSRTSRRRYPPEAVPAFETVWAVSAATVPDRSAAPRGRAAAAHPPPARAAAAPSADPTSRTRSPSWQRTRAQRHRGHAPISTPCSPRRSRCCRARSAGSTPTATRPPTSSGRSASRRTPRSTT